MAWQLGQKYRALHENWRDQVKFRDHLRTNPESKDAYAALKIALAARFPRDREAYIAGKTTFVMRILSADSGGHDPSLRALPEGL